MKASWFNASRVLKVVAIVAVTGCASVPVNSLPVLTYRSDQARHPQALIYVAGVNNGIEEFGADTSRPIWHTMTTAQELAIDSSGRLYALSAMQSFVQVYTKTHQLAYTIKTSWPEFATADSHDNLYVGNNSALVDCPASHPGPGQITEFAPGKTTPKLRIRLGTTYPWAIAFSRERVFVSEARLTGGATCPPTTRFSKVGIAAYSSGSAARGSIISKGFIGRDIPVAPYVDRAGTLYAVSYCNLCSAISTYTPGSTKPSKTIKIKDYVLSLGFDKTGHMYVLEQGATGCLVETYDSSTMKISGSFKTQLLGCSQLSVDNQGELYVSAHTVGVLEFTSSGHLIRTLRAPGVLSMVVYPGA